MSKMNHSKATKPLNHRLTGSVFPTSGPPSCQYTENCLDMGCTTEGVGCINQPVTERVLYLLPEHINTHPVSACAKAVTELFFS